MMTRRTGLLNSFAVMSCILSGWPASAAPSRAMRYDGTVGLNEAKMAASTLFDKLDRDHDGTLDRRELRGRLNATELAAADPDKDGTLDEKELRSRAGQALMRLLQ